MISPHGLQAILVRSAALDGDRSPGRHGVRLADPRVGVRASPGGAGVAVHLDGEVCCHGRVLSFSTTAAISLCASNPYEVMATTGSRRRTGAVHDERILVSMRAHRGLRRGRLPRSGGERLHFGAVADGNVRRSQLDLRSDRVARPSDHRPSHGRPLNVDELERISDMVRTTRNTLLLAPFSLTTRNG